MADAKTTAGRGHSVLIVDDDRDILRLLERVFARIDIACITSETGEDAIEKARAHRPDVVLLDLSLPHRDGLAVLRDLLLLDPGLPVIMITGHGGLGSAVQAIHDGAFDYLAKPLDVAHVRTVTLRALEMRGARGEAAPPEREPQRGEAIVGRHPSMLEIFKLIGAVSRPGNRSTVLVLGETGVGKELVARAIHERGETARGPFVTLQCAGVPETLIENELFGHERGAFTGAHQAAPGRVELAGDGTLFLDEIGDLPPAVQAKVLRLLETSEYERLGGQQSRHARCRFVTATNRDLERAVAAGTFRQDLYYRLRVFTVRVPSLRERRTDIPLLADFFLHRSAAGSGRELELSPTALELLVRYDYPGNVRELQHVLEQAAALTRGPVILPEHLPELLGVGAEDESTESRLPLVSPRLAEARAFVNEMFEREFLRATLSATGGNVSTAAKRAGVRRQYLQRLLKRHGVDPEEFRLQARTVPEEP